MRIYSSEIGTHALEQDHVSGGVLLQSVLHLPPFGPVDRHDPIPEQSHQQCGLHYMGDFNRATVSGRVVHRSLKRRTRSHRTTSCRWCRSQDLSPDGNFFIIVVYLSGGLYMCSSSMSTANCELFRFSHRIDELATGHRCPHQLIATRTFRARQHNVVESCKGTRIDKRNVKVVSRY
jgi:hypothetical protein